MRESAQQLPQAGLGSHTKYRWFTNEGCLIVPFFLYSVGLITTSCNLQLLRTQRVCHLS